jgi:hypothetical protein
LVVLPFALEFRAGAVPLEDLHCPHLREHERRLAIDFESTAARLVAARDFLTVNAHERSDFEHCGLLRGWVCADCGVEGPPQPRVR